MARKTAEEVAAENLDIAERVLEKAKARVEKTAADHDKAKNDLTMAERKVHAARIMAGKDEPLAADPADPVL